MTLRPFMLPVHPAVRFQTAEQFDPDHCTDSPNYTYLSRWAGTMHPFVEENISMNRRFLPDKSEVTSHGFKVSGRCCIQMLQKFICSSDVRHCDCFVAHLMGWRLLGFSGCCYPCLCFPGIQGSGLFIPTEATILLLVGGFGRSPRYA